MTGQDFYQNKRLEEEYMLFQERETKNKYKEPSHMYIAKKNLNILSAVLIFAVTNYPSLLHLREKYYKIAGLDQL